jgi:hypothetical protein
VPIVNGVPIGGFIYFINKEPPAPSVLAAMEVIPPLPAGAGQIEDKWHRPELHLSVLSTPRSLELWKEPGEETVSLVVTSTPSDLPLFTKELDAAYPGTRTERLKEAIPPWLKKAKEYCQRGYDLFLFDYEQDHALPFCAFDPLQPRRLIEDFVRNAAVTEYGVWVQIAYCTYNWSWMAEEASIRMQAFVEACERGIDVPTWVRGPDVSIGGGLVPRIGVPTPKMVLKHQDHPLRGSSLHEHGMQIAREYFTKAQKQGLIAVVRGALLSRQPPEQFYTVHVKPSFDSFVLYSYTDVRFLKWMMTRAIPDPTELLKLHAEGGFMTQWRTWSLGEDGRAVEGEGGGERKRELVPTICLTPEELPLFVHLPTSPNLPIKYTRGTRLPQMGEAPAGRGGIEGEGGGGGEEKEEDWVVLGEF